MVSYTRISTYGLALVLAGLSLPGCVTASKYMLLQDELARTQEELEYSRQNLDKAEDMLLTVQTDQQALEDTQSRLASVEAEKAELARQFDEFRAAHAALAAQGIETIVNREEGMFGYRAKGDVLFSSGSAELTKGGKDALSTVARELTKTQYPIRIDGHTDTDPIVKTKDRWKHGNIELGAHRAIAVREYLVSQGIGEERLHIASFGPHKPVISGKDKEAKARNRRVEIMLQLPPVAQG